WNDGALGAAIFSTAPNQFLIHAIGGVGINTANPTRALEVQHSGDAEIGFKSTDPGGHLWTIQSSGTNTPSKTFSFQIIDRTINAQRFLIDTNGNIAIGKAVPTSLLDVNGTITALAFSSGTFNGDGSLLTNVNATTVAGF